MEIKWISFVLQPFTPLEVEVAALLKGSKNVLRLARELTRAEERALKAMSLEEVRSKVHRPPKHHSRCTVYTHL